MNKIKRVELRSADLGEGMLVKRALPSRHQRMVGAWCFLDHAGPVNFAPGKGMHVGAHPHTALQTFTWLIDGEVLHKDSLGNELIIRPGQVNLMTAGRGIVHTEDSVVNGGRLHAAQLWIALPEALANCDPDFAHYPELPVWHSDGVQFTLLAGSHGDMKAPTAVHSPMLGMDLFSPQGGTVALNLNPDFEYGFLPLTGQVNVQGEIYTPEEFAYLEKGSEGLDMTLGANTRVLLLGGEPFKQPVQMWWNFVGHSKEAIAQAQQAWEQGDARFGDVGSAARLQAPILPWS
ncbi:putative Quercetin 2,3-dioxygenase [Limnobacter sp. 130]|uniref:pirin family protein n=1 Tax=Limnobacter sp. 130 TaxID=2653147 RepID=UPI0012F31C0E|nr:pirin family protein [Limnobacter sp. 130]VWX37102.1 putative Quercetin 2,3-dioxygenase [Limnobacter sp. 130]